MTKTQDIVYAIAASSNFDKDGICFAARQSGLYRSTDGGQLWQFALDSLNLQTDLPAMSVAVSPDFERDRLVIAGVPGGVIRSIDEGQSWEPVFLNNPPPHVSNVVISPNFASDGIALIGTIEDGVLRSNDRGRHWTAWNFGLLDFNTLCLAISPNFAEDDTLFVGTDSGIFRSTNGGRAWREAAFSPDFAPVLSLALSPNYANDDLIFAGTESYGLFCSSDRGESWTRLAEVTIDGAVNSIILSPEFPAKPHLLIWMDNGLLFSQDNGQSWAAKPVNLPADTDITTIATPQGLEPASPLLIGTTGGQVLRI